MSSFYIQKVYAYGSGKKTSVVEFGKGLNIICGPSNTGKSYIIAIIDYIFGGKETPIDPLLGYDSVAIDIVTDKGSKAHLKRKIGTNKVEIESEIPHIESKTYSVGIALNEIYLKLIGIDKPCDIISSQEYKTQALTWRTILKMILISDERISQLDSIVVSSKFKNITAALSAFLYLTDGTDRTPNAEYENKDIKEAKRKAVTAYIKKQIVGFTERNNELNDSYAIVDNADIEKEIERIINEIAEAENKINSATENSKKILKSIYEISAQLQEAEFLQDRYNSLEMQYKSDIQRLRFIIDGENKEPQSYMAKCPFCESEIKHHSHTSYAKSSEAEIHKIEKLLTDLKDTKKDLSLEIEGYKESMQKLNSDNDNILKLINDELNPHTDDLKKALSLYRSKLQIQNEMTFIKNLASKMEADIFENENNEEGSLKYNVKNQFEKETIDYINKYLDQILRECDFPEYLTAHLNLEDFDVVINARKKRVEGKGYRSFINTVFAYVLMKYLSLHAKYAPKLLILDSPIRSLSEKDESMPVRINFSPDGMKNALFKYLVNNQKEGQIIIAENIIPEIDYKDAKLIKFTKDKEIGRYGFLEQPN